MFIEIPDKILSSYIDSYLWFIENIGWDGKPAMTSTIQRQRNELEHILAHPVSQEKLADISFKVLLSTRTDWSQEKKSNGELYSASTINTRIKVLNLLIRHAYQIDDVRLIPPQMPNIRGGERSRRGTALTLVQMKRLLNVFEKDPQLLRFYPLVLLGFLTGARFCELSALHWTDFDWEKMRFKFSRRQSDGVVTEGRKGGAASSWYPLTPELQEVFTRHRENQIMNLQDGERIPYIVFPAKGDPEKLAGAGYIGRSYLRELLAKGCRLAQVPTITPHDLRRSLNTELQRRKMNPELTRAILGHRTEAMTEQYTFFNAEDKVEILSILYSDLRARARC